MIDFAAITSRQQKVWSKGNFSRVAAYGGLLHCERLVEAVDVHAGERVLDVAAGNGNTALTAARRFADVTATDYVPELLADARARAETEGLALRTQAADAQSLPFEPESFDVVLSTFGVMFVPDPLKATEELIRVTRPGGRIGLNSWVADSLIGDLFRATARHVPPLPGLRPVFDWGDESILRERFGSPCTDMRTERLQLHWRFPSVPFAVDYLRQWYGPTRHAFDALDDAAKVALRDELIAVWRQHNVARDGTAAIEAAYLMAVLVKGRP